MTRYSELNINEVSQLTIKELDILLLTGYLEEPEGGAEVGGESVPTLSSLSKGGAEVGGQSNGSFTFEITKDFLFSCGPCVQYWWQIISECKKVDECFIKNTSLIANIDAEVIEGSGSSTDCKRQMLINVMGCNLEQVCDKITKRGYNIKIAEIWKFTLPAFISQQQSGDCGRYERVYPGAVLPQNCYKYESFPMYETWGISFKVEWVGNGGLEFSGEEVSYEITGDGGIELFGDAIPNNITYYSLVENEASIYDEKINSIEPIFGDTIFSGGLSVTTDIVANSCDCGTMPINMSLTHNLNNSDRLSNFLTRNNLTFPKNIELIYNLTNYSWQANYHFKGYGDDGFSNEIWDIVFEWACTDEVGSMTVDQIWKFGFYSKVKNIDKREYHDTRILAIFNPTSVCPKVYNAIYYGFKLNTESKVITSVDTNKELNMNVDLNTCYDNIGLFTSDDWLANPVLVINIWQAGRPTEQKYLDMSRFIPTRQKIII